MKLLGTVFTIFTLVFMGCSDQNNNVTNPKGAEPERQSSNKTKTSYVTFQQVKNDLESAGAVEVGKPSGFSPSFEGYDSVKHYSKPSESKIYHVYIFEGPNSAAYQSAAGYCTLDWVSTGLCGYYGDDCRWEDTDDDGDLDVVCCGDNA